MLQGDAVTTVNKDWTRLYNEFPEKYDEFAEAQDADESVLSHVLSHVDLTGREVLDIGGGSGRYTRRIARDAAKVYCYDPCGPLIEVARTRGTELGLTNIEYGVAPAQQVPLASDSVDVVLAAHSITAIEARDFSRGQGDSEEATITRFQQRAVAVNELLRVLRPGGWIFSVSPAPDNYGGGLSAMVLGEWNDEWSRGKRQFLRWMSDEFGFVTSRLQADWRFPSAAEAARIYGFVYGAEVQQHVLSNNVVSIDNPLVIQSLRKPPTDLQR